MTNQIRHLVVVILTLSFFLTSCGQAPADSEKPVVALVKEGGWVMYTGPDFVLYETGLVVYKRQSNLFPPEYFSVNLTQEETQHLLGTLSLSEEFLDLDARYELTRVTDHVTNWILLWGSVQKTVGVYGYIPTPSRRSDAYQDPPTAFVRVFEHLDAFDHPRASKWMPSRLEVRVYPMPKKKWIEDPIPWPAHWPSLDDPGVNQTNPGSYYFYAAGGDLELLKTIAPKVGQEHLVQAGDAQFKVQYTLRVPNEVSIAATLRKAQQ